MWSRGNGTGDAGSQRRIVAIGRRQAERSLKRLEWNGDVSSKLCLHVLEIKIYIFDLTLRIILRQQTSPQTPGIIEHSGPGKRMQPFIPDLQHVTRFRAVHGNRADDGVRSLARVA